MKRPQGRGRVAAVAEAGPAKAAPSDRSNVIGFGLSKKVKGGQRKRGRCLTFYVLRKRPPGELSREEMLPAKLHGLPTDVVVIERPRMIVEKLNPGEGVDLAAFNNPAAAMSGTVSAVLSSADGRRFLLSNNHVFSQCGHLPAGSSVDWTDPAAGFPETVAVTADAVPLVLPPGLNSVDAALALISLPDLTDVVMAGILQLASPLPAAAVQDRRVVKHGATTGTTRGTIISTHGQFPLEGPDDLNLEEVYQFEEVILIDPDPDPMHPEFCDRGDSGSLLIDEQSRRAVGIVMGKAGARGVACPLQPALARLSAIIDSPLSLLI